MDSKGWVIVRVAVVWECGGKSVVCGGMEVYSSQQELSPAHQSNMSRLPKGTRRGGGYRVKVHKGQRAQEKGGARSNVGRIQDDTTTPQNHNHNAAPNRRRQGRGQMKN